MPTSKTPVPDERADDPHNVPVVVWSLIGGIFFVAVGGGVAFPTLPALGTILDISPFVVGIILAIASFSRLITNTPAGQIVDSRGTRKPMVVGMVFAGLGSFGYAIGLYHQVIPLVGPSEIFIVSRALWGVGSAFVLVGAFSTIIHITTEDTRGKWIGYFRGGQALGFPAGLIVGGIVTDLYGYELAFGVAGATGLFAAGVALVVLPDISGPMRESARLAEVPGIVRTDLRIFMIGCVNFTVRFLFVGVLLSTVVLYAQTHETAIGGFSSVGASGIFLAIAVIFSSGTTVISGNLSDEVDNRALVTVPALALFAIGFAILGVVPTVASTIAGVALIGVGVGGTNPPLLAFLGDISPKADVGKMGGVYNVFGDLGSTVGPLVALPLGAIIGYRMEYLLCAGITVLLLMSVGYTLMGVGSEVTKPPETSPE